MRLAVGDFGANYVRVFLDDAEQTLCTMADEDAGVLSRWVEESLTAKPTNFRLETLRGRVRIEVIPGHGIVRQGDQLVEER